MSHKNNPSARGRPWRANARVKSSPFRELRHTSTTTAKAASTYPWASRYFWAYGLRALKPDRSQPWDAIRTTWLKTGFNDLCYHLPHLAKIRALTQGAPCQEIFDQSRPNVVSREDGIIKLVLPTHTVVWLLLSFSFGSWAILMLLNCSCDNVCWHSVLRSRVEQRSTRMVTTRSLVKQ